MKIKMLTAAIATLVGGFAQTSLAATAITGQTPTIPTPIANIYLAGSSAQDTAIKTILNTKLCNTGTLQIFQDNYGGTTNTTYWGGRWAAYYCTLGSSSAVPTALRGQVIAINKRSAGGSGYGILSVVDNTVNHHTPFAVNFLSVGTSNCTMKDTSQAITTYGCAATENFNYSANASCGGVAGGLTTSCATNVFQSIPDAGVADTNPGLYTGPNAVLDFGSKGSVTAADVATLNVTPAAALTFTVPVTNDLYIALQDAQGIFSNSSCLPNANGPVYGTSAGDDSCMPSLSTNQLNALVSGSVPTWNSVSFDNGATTLDQHASHTSTGTAPSDLMVHFVQRSAGSGTAAIHYAKLLSAPCAGANASSPASDNTLGGGPAVHTVYETADMEAGLDDLQGGSQVVKDYLTGAVINSAAGNKVWAFGQLSADKNTASSTNPATGTYSHAYRHIKINGVSPNLQNTFRGAYPVWAESAWVYSNKTGYKPTGDKLLLIQYLISQATLASTIQAADKAQQFGVSGYLGLPDTTANTITTSLATTLPITATSQLPSTGPVIPFSYPSGDNCQNPVPYSPGSTLVF